MSSLKEYYALLAVWRKKYGEPPKYINANLTKIRTACYRCQRSKTKMHRHHTGNDLMFAKMLPNDFALRYMTYHKDDVEKLCHICHKRAHKIYKPITAQVWCDLTLKGQKIITKSWCENWMELYRKTFYTWAIKFKPRKS